ncbi:hypothetical protein D3C78_1228470 [compost metagenome]
MAGRLRRPDLAAAGHGPHLPRRRAGALDHLLGAPVRRQRRLAAPRRRLRRDAAASLGRAARAAQRLRPTAGGAPQRLSLPALPARRQPAAQPALPAAAAAPAARGRTGPRRPARAHAREPPRASRPGATGGVLQPVEVPLRQPLPRRHRAHADPALPAPEDRIRLPVAGQQRAQHRPGRRGPRL